MINNTLKTTLRQLWRNRLYIALNVLGLFIGISACGVVYRIADDKISYNQQHPNPDRIYRIVGRHNTRGRESGFGGVPIQLVTASPAGNSADSLKGSVKL